MTQHPRLTARQKQVLDFMRSFFAENDQLPTMQAICDQFGWKSPNAAVTFSAILEDRGYIEKNAVGRYRFCRQQPDPDATQPMPITMIREMERDGIRVATFRGA